MSRNFDPFDFGISKVVESGNALIESWIEIDKRIAKKDAALKLAKDALISICWWTDGYDESAVYRCVACDVERDDAASGADTHHESCRVAKALAAIDEATKPAA